MITIICWTPKWKSRSTRCSRENERCNLYSVIHFIQRRVSNGIENSTHFKHIRQAKNTNKLLFVKISKLNESKA